MATKRTLDPRAELRALNYMVRVLIITHPDRAKLATEIGKATVRVESAMLATTTPDDLIEQVKEHLLYFRELALGKHKRPRTGKPRGEAK